MLQNPEQMKEFKLFKFIKPPRNLNMASYLIANLIEQRGRPLMDRKFIKQILIDVAPVIFKDMESVDKIIIKLENKMDRFKMIKTEEYEILITQGKLD
jgi:hypothetical protein